MTDGRSCGLPAARREEGVFVEPARGRVGGRAAAGREQGTARRRQRVVCTVTGNGLKDPEWAISGAPAPITIPADVTSAAKALGLLGLDD